MSIDLGILQKREFADAVVSLLVKDKEFLANYGSVIDPGIFRFATHKALITLVQDFYRRYDRGIRKDELRTEIDCFHKAHAETELGRAVKADELWKEAIRVSAMTPDREWVADRLGAYVRIRKTTDLLTRYMSHVSEGKEVNYEHLLAEVENVKAVGGLGQNEVRDAADEIDMLMEVNSRRIVSPTPWPTINKKEIMGGGLAATEYGVILSYSNVGKSTILCQLGVQALRYGSNVVHISCEDKKREVLQRYAANLTKIPRTRMTPDCEARQAVDIFRSVCRSGRLGKLFIMEYMEYELRASEIEGMIRSIERRHKLKIDVLIVDYAQVLKPDTLGEDGQDTKGQGNWNQIEDTHRILRRTGRKLDCGVWSAHQAKEQDKRKEILRLNDMGKSKASGQVPEILMSLNETEEREDDYEVQLLFVARNRLGEKYEVVKLQVDKNTVRYREAG